MRDFSYSEMEKLINEYVTGRKSLRNREIMRLCLLDGLTNREIAEITDMSETQIQRITHKYSDMLFLKMK